MSAAVLQLHPAPTDLVGVGPHDLDAEAAVLSNCLISTLCLPQVRDFLLAEHFFSERHRRIYEACIEVTDAGHIVEIVTVGGWLKARDRLAQVGGMGYLTEVLNASPALANVRPHGMLVHDAWRRRAGALYMQRQAIVAWSGQAPDVQAWSEETVRGAAQFARLDPRTRHEEHHETGARALEEMSHVRNGGTGAKMFGLSTGLPTVDRAMRGLCAGEVTVVSATPGGGKTVFGDQVACAAAAANVGVLVFAVADMNRDELHDRRMARLASVDHSRITTSRNSKAVMTTDEIGRHTEAVCHSAAWPLVVIDRHGISIDEICAIATRCRDTKMHSGLGDGSRVPLGLIVVDYIQEVRPPAGAVCGKKWEWSELVAPRLKLLAAELGVAILELAQMHKPDARAKGSGKPSLGSTRGSAEIEAKANTIGYLWKPEKSNVRRRELVLVKVRGGGETEVDLELDGAFAKLTDVIASPAWPGRQYVDRTPEPPPGRFDDENDPTIDGEYR